MAKEFEGLNQAIQDSLGTLEKISSDAKLLKDVEKYIKEDPLAYLGWQMYKMNVIDLKKSEQPLGENLIRFDDGRRVEIGGVYGRKGLKSIPVRTGAEKSENVVVFDESAPILGSVVYAKGARKENLELLTVLHELRHAASRYLQNKHPEKFFKDETDFRIEEDQQRVADLNTLISTGDYKDGQLSDRAALAFADKEQLTRASMLAEKNAKLALEELDSLNVSVPKQMRDSANKLRTVFDFQLGEKDKAAIQYAKDSLERVRLKKENGDVDMMELDSGPISKEEQLLAHSRGLIHWDESKNGTQKEVDAVGAKYTRGNFHITRERAQDTQYGKELASKYSTDKAFADYLYDNPKVEVALLREISLDTIRSNPFLLDIDSKTAAAIITSMHNLKTQPNLKKACNTYAKQIKAGAKNLDEFKRACVSQIDVNKGKVPIDKDNPEAGTREVFLPGLALKSLSLQEYALSEDEDADYKSITVNVANKYKNTDDVDLKKEVVNKSQIGRVSLQMKNMWDSVRVEEKQPIVEEKQPIVEVPVRVLKGVTPPPKKPPEGPEEISGFPAQATFP